MRRCQKDISPIIINIILYIRFMQCTMGLGNMLLKTLRSTQIGLGFNYMLILPIPGRSDEMLGAGNQ